ncbi:MAG: DUF2330 domain-containing protein [Archangiaceae bacterium]|nr:DUF2330 domain-containing protein [Archangiaceae bacterium]
MNKLTTWSLLSAGVLCLAAPAAQACGCFAPPDPTVPIVQAGERILFALKDGQVTAHVQIQYAGDAKDFGWLLPLPSVPVLELGSDEVFTQLYNTSQPKYRLTRTFEGTCGFGNLSNLAPTALGGAEDASRGGQDPEKSSPLVIQDSIGPYDYAVLKADSRDDMFQWLTDNHYFIPTGTDATVGNYTRPGAYFLALKLKSGKSAGDLQPVVVRYPSQLPMIPIILTSVAAQPNMGVQVWMLGSGRAIPRNFHHAVVNDALIDWQTGGQNYNDVIIRAANGAPDKHAFVTEYSGTSDVMKGVLDYPGRFGDKAALAASADAVAFIEYLFQNGFSTSSQVVTILGRYVPVPASIAAANITAAQFYRSIRYYSRGGSGFDLTGWSVDYQPTKMADELWTAVVEPSRKAQQLFAENPVLTRMYTTLSPEDMNKDPVFSYNPELPAVDFVHQATLTYHCFDTATAQQDTPAVLRTEQGWVLNFPRGTVAGPAVDVSTLPGALRYEILPEEGAPEVTHDNAGKLNQLVGPHALCAVAPTLPGVALLALLVLRRRRTP